MCLFTLQRPRSHTSLMTDVTTIHLSTTLRNRSNEMLKIISRSTKCSFTARLSLNQEHMLFYTLLRDKIYEKEDVVVFATKYHFSGLRVNIIVITLTLKGTQDIMNFTQINTPVLCPETAEFSAVAK